MTYIGYVASAMAPAYIIAGAILRNNIASSWANTSLYMVGLALMAWIAFRALFKKSIQHLIAVVIALVAVTVNNAILFTRKKISLPRKMRNIQKDIPQRSPVAKKSIELARVHPKILRPDLSAIIGYDNLDNPIKADFSEAHTLVGGSTGGGKTNLINSILIQLFSTDSNSEIYIIDLKGNVEDGLYRWGAICSYVDEEREALELLSSLVEKMRVRQRRPVTKPIFVIIDEIADITQEKSGVRLLSILARKSRSAGIFLLIATQYPRYDILDKSITYMLMRKICLAVATAQQGKVIIGSDIGDLPKRPGEFVMEDGAKRYRGKTLRVSSSEVDLVLSRKIESKLDSDPRMRLWKIWAIGGRVGDNTSGIHATYKQHPGMGQVFIKDGKKHLVEAGVLEAPHGRGQHYKLKVDFWTGVSMIERYIGEGKWQ